MNERKELRKERQRQKLEKESIDKVTSALLRSPDGRKFLWWLLDIGRYGQIPFTGNALTGAFQCGELNVGQQVLAQLTETDPEGFLILLKERSDERYNDKQRDDGNGDDESDDRDGNDD